MGGGQIGMYDPKNKQNSFKDLMNSNDQD